MSLDTDDPGMNRLLFDPEYQDFQTKYMDDVLSSDAFSEIIDNTECPWIVRGYLSAFLSMFYNWKQGGIVLTMKDFVKQSAELFEHGLNGTDSNSNNATKRLP